MAALGTKETGQVVGGRKERVPCLPGLVSEPFPRSGADRQRWLELDEATVRRDIDWARAAHREQKEEVRAGKRKEGDMVPFRTLLIRRLDERALGVDPEAPPLPAPARCAPAPDPEFDPEPQVPSWEAPAAGQRWRHRQTGDEVEVLRVEELSRQETRRGVKVQVSLGHVIHLKDGRALKSAVLTLNFMRVTPEQGEMLTAPSRVGA